MRFTVEHAVFIKALSHIQSVVEKRTANQILSNVKLEAVASPDGGYLSLSATNTELEITEKIPATIENPGQVTAPAHKIYELVRKLPDGSEIAVSFNQAKEQLNISCNRSKFVLPTMPVADFYQISEEKMPNKFALPAQALKDAINRAEFAISSEETRHYLNGIYMHDKGGKVLKFAATDGHRLACNEMPLPSGAEGIPGAIIPRKTVGELSKLLDVNADANVVVSLSANLIRFNLKDIVLTSKLIEGTFPDYETVIPSGNDKMMEADASMLKVAIERVSVISEKTKGVKLLLKKGTCLVSSGASEDGSAEEELEVSYNFEKLDIGFNYKYLIDTLSRIRSGTVRFSLNDATSPVLLTDVADDRALYVLMPMRV